MAECILCNILRAHKLKEKATQEKFDKALDLQASIGVGSNSVMNSLQTVLSGAGMYARVLLTNNLAFSFRMFDKPICSLFVLC